MFLDIFGVNSFVISLYYQIFSWVSNLYGFIFDLTNTASFFDSTYINSIWKTLYSIVGIFMLFRIVISMLQYLVDPDKLTDKSAGGGKLAARIVISIVLVLAMPFIFDFLQKVQNVVVGNDGLLSNFAKSISNGNEDNSYGGASTSYYDKYDDGVFTKILSKGFSLIVPEVKALNLCEGYDDLYEDFFKIKWAYKSSLPENFSETGPDGSWANFKEDMYYNNCQYSNKNDLEQYTGKAIKEALSKLTGNEALLCYNYAGGGCNSQYTISWIGLNAFKDKLNNSKYNYGVCNSQSDYDNNNNCYNIYYISEPSDSSKNGSLKDIVVKRICSNNDYGVPSVTFANCRFEFYVTYYQNQLTNVDMNCYYAYIGTAGTGYDFKVFAKPFQTYVKINFKGSNDDKYMNVSFIDGEENQIKLEGEPQKIALKDKISSLLSEKGASTTQSSLSKLNKFQSNIVAKSAGCWSSGDGCTEMNYKNNDINNIYSMLNKGKCPWLVFEGNNSDGDLNCFKEQNSNAYGQNGNYSEPAEYTCWIYGKKTLRIVSDEGKEKKTPPRFACPSTSFDEMVNCAREKSDGYGVESAFSTLDPEVWNDVLNSAATELVNNWDSYGITGATKSEVGDYLNIYVEEETEKVKASQEAIEEFKAKQKRGNEAANSFAGTMMLAFIDILKSDIDDDVMKCLDASKILHGSASNGGESCQSILTDADDDDQIYISAFMGLIMGLIVIVLLATLAVDVIIRNAKILLLQIISPVAILSFINPKDKIFSQWVKMYGATFADLFIKLLAIMLIPIILSIFNIGSQDGLTKIFMILGVLAFAKAAPAFISKIFGISDMAGSFKDAGKMLKTAAFTAAGTGLAVGAAGIGAVRNGMAAHAGGLGTKGAWAAGLRGAAGIFGAGLRGAGAGMKGDVFAGAKGAWATAGSRSALYRQGVGTAAQISAGTLGLFGMDYASQKDKEVEQLKAEQDNLKRAQEYKSNIDNLTESSDFGKDVIFASKNGEYVIKNNNDRKKLSESWAEAQYQAAAGGSDFKKYCADKGFDFDDESAKNSYVKDAMSKVTNASGQSILSPDLLNQVKFDSGKAAGIVTQVEQAAGFTQLSIDGVTRKTVEKDGTKVEESINISSAKDVFDLEKNAKIKFSANKTTIENATINDPKYVQIKAAKEARNKNGSR